MFHFIFLILITNSISLYISKCEKLIAKANEINKNSDKPNQVEIINQQNVAFAPEPSFRKLSGYMQISDKSLQNFKSPFEDLQQKLSLWKNKHEQMVTLLRQIWKYSLPLVRLQKSYRSV